MIIKLGRTCRFDINQYFVLKLSNQPYLYSATCLFQSFNAGVKPKPIDEAFSK